MSSLGQRPCEILENKYVASVIVRISHFNIQSSPTSDTTGPNPTKLGYDCQMDDPIKTCIGQSHPQFTMTTVTKRYF